MKIQSDTGWKENIQLKRNCYMVEQRKISFTDADSKQVQDFVDTEMRAWYGQEFTAHKVGDMVIMTRSVDSSG